MRNLDGLKLGHGWNKGMKFPYAPRPKAKGRVSPNKDRLGIRNNPDGEFKKHPFVFWHGTKNEYRNLHKRITRKLGRPTQCARCFKDGLVGKQIHWANVSGEYSTEKSDWMRLCARCHVFHDREKKQTLVY